MLKQTDLQGRLRLLRYGLAVVVAVTFVVSLSFPVVALQGVDGVGEVGNFLGTSILYTVIVAVICVGIYFAYDFVLHRTMGPQADAPKAEEQK